jgi:hypothetical protein
MKKLIALLLLPALAGAASAMLARAPDAAVLLRSYYRYLLTQQVGAQVQTMTAPLPKADAAAVQAAVTAWNGQRMEVVRQDLVVHFGEQGRPKFEQFFAAYSEAEKNNDAGYLRELCGALGARPPLPADYAALRQLGLTSWLQADIQASSKFLADVQTWLQLKNRTPNMPPLNVWLARDATAALAVADARVAPPPPKTVAQQLASAEATMPEFKAEDEAAPGSNPLEAFAAQRKERRERAVKEAQEAMAQVATERQAAEQEYASKKQAEASAEAEALKNHAQRLADAEKQAIEQEKDSWSAKLKGIVGATITAAGGAFFGGVGAQAGQMAANFIFQAVPGLGGAPATAPSTSPTQ